MCQPEIMMGVLPERELAFPSVLAVQHLRREDEDKLLIKSTALQR